ncbi:sugar phosphate isomerase/epimerase [Cellulophaga baltica]|uniref:sugar phosphate isomerase/epimerase family protein n=1 Tax=Cellulophaga TaxID=104264 RepID=UPI001C074F68|nr:MULTISPECIES: TIM barrel protein [Cellulophaga]MBU2997140.1 sugar phosphate isomerase/epimerase [Cellulophaga baltica]MDO6768538.1 TIM barrel protein [Cellulophaga sp. 1_MG-2023]
MKKLDNSRRDFIKKSAMASSSLVLPTNLVFKKHVTENNIPKVYIFSKQLQFLNYIDMCDATKEMGFDGLDLTVRAKGHVLPEKVADDLPKVTEVMHLYKLTPQLITTKISDTQLPSTKLLLKTASDLGYTHYRPSYFKYKKDTPVLKTVETVQNSFIQLEKLNNKFSINLAYQNHSGHYFGASIWDLHQVLAKMTVNNIGSQYDIMHATVEGGKNWEVGFHLIKPYINSVVLKDFKWVKTNNKWEIKYTPLGDGMVDFDRFFKLLKENKINAPICLHAEYDLGGAEHGNTPSISQQEVFKRLKQDLNFIKRKWNHI